MDGADYLGQLSRYRQATYVPLFVLGILVVALVGMAVGLLPGILWSDFGRIGSLSEALMAYATIILALITSLYVFVTYLLLRESKDSREQDVAPIVTLDFNGFEPSIINLGNGPASHVEFTLQGVPGGEKHSFYFSNLSSDWSVSIKEAPYEDLIDPANEPSSKYDAIEMRGMCVDGFKNERSIDWTFETERVEDQLWGDYNGSEE